MPLNSEPTEPLAPVEQATLRPPQNQNVPPPFSQNIQPRQNSSAKLRRLLLIGGVVLVVILVGVIGSVFALQLRSTPSSNPGIATGKTTPTAHPSPAGATPTVVTNSANLALDYQTQNATPNSNQIQMGLKLINTGSAPIDLSNVTIRYWYTADSSQNQLTVCDYATVDCSNIQSQLVKLNPPQPTADTYLEIGFTAGTLAPNGTTEIQIRVHKSDWSNYNQGNDYSFVAGASNFSSAQHMGVYYKGTLVSGSAPA